MSKSEPKTELPPTGTVTLMFTDMSGSSRLWETFGDRFIPVWQAHDAILRDSFARFGGFEVKTEGDSFMVAFADAAAALNCALFVQAALCRYPWPEDIGQPRIKVGLHTGEPFLYNSDYFGPVVNRAAHICNSAHGGQVLFSSETLAAIGDKNDPKIVIQDLGEFRLKDMGTPQCLYQATHPSYDAPRFPPHTLDSQPNNLPVQSTTFVGRAKEIEQVAAFLAKGEKPVLTLTGPGGIGKTRLSLQAAAATAEWFPDGVWYVQLVQATDVESAAEEIAEAMHIALKKGQTVLPQVRTFLAGRQCLLILDDANRVPEADRLIRELLTDTHGLRCLATSRESLQIAESDDLTVGGLNTQPEGEERVIETDAGRLFIERAASEDPNFKMSPKETQSAEELLDMLDGVPFSIESAAKMMDKVPPSVVLEWLNQHLEPNRVPAKSAGVEKFRKILRGGAQKVYETVEERTRLGVANLGQLVQSVASVAADRHNDAKAAELGRESLKLSQEAGDDLGVAISLRQLAGVKWRNGDKQSAIVLHSAALQLARRHDAPNCQDYERELAAYQAQLQPEDGVIPVTVGIESAVQMAMEQA